MTEPATIPDIVASEEEEAEPGLKEQNLRFVLLKAIADAAAEELGRLRVSHLSPLLEQYKTNDATSFKVRLPIDGDGPAPLVATVSLSVPKDHLEIGDEDAFIAWCEANHPDAVNVEHIPGQPEHVVVVPATEDRVEKTLIPKAVTAILKQLKIVNEGIVDPSTGAVTEGVVNVPGSDPKQFSVKYEPDGREQLAGAYRAGKLDHIVSGTTLPEVAGIRTVIERRLESVPAAPVAPVEGDGGRHEYSLRSHFPPRGAPHPLGECRSRGCPTPAEAALGEDYGTSDPLAGESPALVDYSGSHGRLNGVPATGEDEFDPGSW